MKFILFLVFLTISTVVVQSSIRGRFNLDMTGNEGNNYEEELYNENLNF